MKKLQQQRIKVSKLVMFFGMGMISGVILLVGIARLTWHGKFYPGVKVASISIAGLNREQARGKIERAANEYQLKLTFNGSDFVVPKESVAFQIEDSLNEAYHYGRRLRVEDYLLLLINKKTNYPLKLNAGKTEKLDAFIAEMAHNVEISPVEAEVNLANKKITITNGSDGILLSSNQLDEVIKNAYGNLDSKPVEIPTHVIKRQLGDQAIGELRARAEKLLGKNLLLKLDDERINLIDRELVKMLSTTDNNQVLDEQNLGEYVGGLAASLNKDPQDAKFEFENGKVKEFAPGKDGVKIDEQASAVVIKEAIEKLVTGEEKRIEAQLVADHTPPKVTTEKVNELGIKERIGRGESYYQHSIPNRIFNVALASSRVNSALIGPGEEVSFNKLVGEVSGATGYREAYIISGGRTVLGDGGGLCQVSTTMFRAAMSAGLPIIERWGHAYRVSYYELNSKPGVDATVIAPSKDFRFKNDTPGHILIQTINDPKKLHLVIEIYGTSDGRVATMSDPKVWGITPPLPTIYQDDPSLPSGTTKQVDWAASGAKASFEYKVTRNGETLQDKTFTTSYRPWASVYLRGTGSSFAQ